MNSPEFPDFETRALYRSAVALAIKDMTDAGLDIVTDGCQHYEMESDYEQGEIFHYYLDRLEGFVPNGDRISAGAFDNSPIYKPTCVGPIGRRRSPSIWGCHAFHLPQVRRWSADRGRWGDLIGLIEQSAEFSDRLGGRVFELVQVAELAVHPMHRRVVGGALDLVAKRRQLWNFLQVLFNVGLGDC